jgi:WD domain, G-beta repeat
MLRSVLVAVTVLEHFFVPTPNTHAYTCAHTQTHTHTHTHSHTHIHTHPHPRAHTHSHTHTHIHTHPHPRAHTHTHTHTHTHAHTNKLTHSPHSHGTHRAISFASLSLCRWITAVLFRENGQMISASADNTLRMWDVASVSVSGEGSNSGGPTKKLTNSIVFKGHKDTVTSLVICADDLFSGSADNTIRR